MILYLDSSALVKLLVVEEGSDEAAATFASSEKAGTSVIAYAEARAALARAVAERGVSSREATGARRRLDRLWPDLLVTNVDSDISRRGGELAERHLLRGMDAIHLATALVLTETDDVVFLSWDKRQRRGAGRERLAVLPRA